MNIPLIAIGGIDHSNAMDVIRAGADGLCAISSVVAKEDVSAEIKKFQDSFGHSENSSFCEIEAATPCPIPQCPSLLGREREAMVQKVVYTF